MKAWLTFFFACLCLSSWGKDATFEKLCEINRCWTRQKDAAVNDPASCRPTDETGWIDLHLRLVEQALRDRSTAGLNPQQASNRMRCLDYLVEYRRAGKFPVNKDYSYHTPVFIDKQDNFCAVGYLLKASGNERISRKIAAGSNFAYVKEMAYPELKAWATENGFTIDELAWIQPGYSPPISATAIGKGVDGEVMELYADNDEGKLYVGGSFTKADDTLTANNIACVTEAAGVYTWHSMGDGMSGPVYAITKYKGKIYAAGGSYTFAGSNVACWDDTSWSGVGCTSGTINDLAVMNGELYAAGAFNICAGATGVSFARWNGTEWQPLPGLTGKVNTMQVMDTTLILGGAFVYNNTQFNAVRWSRGTGFRAFANAVLNEVTDFEPFNDTLYAACKRTNTIDSINLIVRLVGNQWLPLQYNNDLHYFIAKEPPVSFNTLCADGTRLMMGGNFTYRPMTSIQAFNCYCVMEVPWYYGTWFDVDSAINKMVIFKKYMVAGGRFKTGYGSPVLNGIGKIPAAPLYVPAINQAAIFECYPNPATAAGSITIRNSFGANQYAIRDLNGKWLDGGILASLASQQVYLPRLIPGIYLLEVWNEKGYKMVKRLTLE